MIDLTQQYLKSRLDYDPATGIFLWKQSSERPPEWNTKYARRVAGSPNDAGYLRIGLCDRRYYAHRLAWIIMTGENPGKMEIDHINENKSDNSWSNLRLATHNQNRRNQGMHADNKSGYKGVSWDSKCGNWLAQITADGKAYPIGRHETKEKAHAAYVEAARILHAEFAHS